MTTKEWLVEFIVRRNSTDELTYAVVKARVEAHERPGERAFLALLTKALTEWKRTTADGKGEWESSVEDFNVGDLSNCLPCAVLEKILAKHGIHKLIVETNSEDQECRYWSYDTVLMDDDE